MSQISGRRYRQIFRCTLVLKYFSLFFSRYNFIRLAAFYELVHNRLYPSVAVSFLVRVHDAMQEIENRIASVGVLVVIAGKQQYGISPCLSQRETANGVDDHAAPHSGRDKLRGLHVLC